MSDFDLEEIAAAAGIAIVPEGGDNCAVKSVVNVLPTIGNDGDKGEATVITEMCPEEAELDALFANRYTSEDPDFSDDILTRLAEAAENPPMMKDLSFRAPRNNSNNWRGRDNRRGGGDNRGGWGGQRGGNRGGYNNDRRDNNRDRDYNRGGYGGNYGGRGGYDNRDSRPQYGRERSPHR